MNESPLEKTMRELPCPETVAAFWPAAAAAGYSHEAARWALYQSMRAALGLSPGGANVLDAPDENFVTLFDVLDDRVRQRALVADAWQRLTLGPRGPQ